MVDGKRHVTVARAVRVRRRCALVQREFDFGAALGIAKINERESIEVEAMRLAHAERVLIERNRAIQRCNADHEMEEFGHARARVVASLQYATLTQNRVIAGYYDALAAVCFPVDRSFLSGETPTSSD